MSEVESATGMGRVGSLLAPALSARAVFRRFWPTARPEAARLAAGALLLVLAAALDVVAVSTFSTIADRALSSGKPAAFWGPAFVWAGCAVVSGVLVFGGQYLTAKSAERFLLRLRTRVFRHLQTLSPDFFERRRHGDLVARTTADVETVEAVVNSGLVQLATSLLSVLFFAGAAFYLRWELALAAIAVVPAFILIARGFARRINGLSRTERALNGELTAVLEEDLANVAVVQAYNRQPTEERRLHAHGVRLLDAAVAIAKLSALYSPLVHVCETVCVLGVLGLGSWEIAEHRITLGGVLAFAALLGYLYGPLQSLGELRVMISAATTGSERLIELLDAEPSVSDRPDAKVLGRACGHLRFEQASFGYGGGRRAVDTLSLEIRPGETLAVTGASGAGKSTVAKLLLRFYDPDAGALTLDGVDLRDLTLESLRRNVTLLAQETLIFHGSIRDNIAYGRHGAGDAVLDAARAADAHEFIIALPDGYDTVIGQHGHGLSGGQRKRVAVARALVADAPVLVLDEPTAGLDAHAAERLSGPLRRLAAGRTTLLITHDLRLAGTADRVVVLDGGRIVQTGAPADLLAVAGPYRLLARSGR